MSKPRAWHAPTMPSIDAAPIRAFLIERGYVERASSGPGSFDDWRDIDPRHGTSWSDLYVVEDPACPIVDELLARWGGVVRDG